LDVVVSDLLYKVFKIRPSSSFKFDVNAAAYNSNNLLGGTTDGFGRFDRLALNVKLVKSFLNDKIIINVGQDFDFAVPGNTTTLVNTDLTWLPNVNVEFVLNQSRRLKLIVFRRNSFGVGQNSSIVKRNRTGVSLSFSHEFDKFFHRKEDEEKKKGVSSQ
jgi:hypothetical protein